MKRSCSKHLKNRGFALVITVSILVLLALVAVGLLTLSTVTVRSSARGSAQREARSNARLALMIALGELQKNLGPDQRVSAAAGILDESPETLEVDGVEHPWWTAVWSTKWAGSNGTSENVTPWVRNDVAGGLSDRRFKDGFEREKEVLAYLVSGNEGGREQTGDQDFLDAVTTKLTAEEQIVLVGPGTLGTAAGGGDDSKNVVARRVPTMDGTREVGAYAYWVGDLGIKANVGQVDRYHEVDPQRGGNAGGMERLLHAQDTAEEFVKDLGSIAVDETDRIVSEQSIALANGVERENAQARFHDITQGSRSVLTNVRQGGLQRDLTSFLNSRSGEIPDLVMDGERIAWGIDPTDKMIGPANEDVAIEQGTTWQETKYHDIAPSFAMLRHWNDIGQQLAFTKEDHDMVAPTGSTQNSDQWTMNQGGNVYDNANKSPAGILPLDTTNLSPVMVEGSIFYNLASFPDTPGSTRSEYNLRICLYPRVALWNPYNVKLELTPTVAEIFVNGNKDVEVRYLGRTAPKRVRIPFGRGSTRMDVKYTGTDKSPEWYVGTLLFTLPAVTLEPGETLVFSPDQAAEYKLDSIGQNTLSPNVAPDPTRYYWSDMKTKHAQKPDKFIESPGGGNSSGGDNYVMALKAATGSSRRITDEAFDSMPQIVYANTSLQAGGGDELPVQWSSNTEVEVYALASETSVLPGNAIPDVRTRDGSRFRWWNEDLPSNIAASGQLQGAPKHFQSAIIANWNPRAAYFSRTPWDNVSDLPPHFYGCYTRDAFDPEVSWAAMAPRLRNGKMLGSPFSQPIDGPEQLVLFEVPRKETGIPSIGYLRHLKLSEFGWHPSYAVGNSLADPRVGRKTTSPVLGRTERDFNGWNEKLFGWHNSGPGYWAQLTREILFNRADDHFVVYDLSYEANFNLWDNYFMSTGTVNQKKEFLDDPLKHPLPNGRIGLRATSDNLERDLNDFHRAATQLMLEGGFNVHSTSKEAWKAILATTADTGFGSSGAIPFPRLLNSPEGEWLDGGARDKEATAGFRSLSDIELDALAEEIVREVKERAPFFGLADFVNRRLVDSEHGDKGPIEAAIDAAGINDTFDQEFPLDNDYDLPDVSFFNMSDTTRMDQTLKPSSTAWGVPGYLTQGDVMQVVGSSLTARSDTFMIRAYGESVDAEGKVLAQAWCEATVQRTPEPVNPDGAGLNPVKVESGELDYGRRFRMVTFRWMSPEEV